MKRKNGGLNPWATSDDERKKLDVNFGLIIAIALILTLIIYVLVLPFRDSFLGIILYDRGWTQYLAVWFSAIVITLTVTKWIKVRKERSFLQQNLVPDIPNLFNDPQNRDLLSLQKNLARSNSLLATRCSRVIAAYFQSGSRKSASEIALDDSSFYLSSSESSYAFPRILVWAIPLLGFIGTVFGISEAVNGFSGLLDKAGDIEQIKKGIGTVTTGLAIAFDTTLLALLLSILVMIPLVLVERYEARLLLTIDIFIHDRLLANFGEKQENLLDNTTINQTISEALKEHLPSPESLIEPAHQYAQQAVTQFTQNFINELGKLQNLSSSWIQQIEQINQINLQDRNQFAASIDEQQKNQVTLLSNLENIIELIRSSNLETAQNMFKEAEKISKSLENTANLLENRLNSLEQATLKMTEINQIKEGLQNLNNSLVEVLEAEKVLTEIKDNLDQIKPSLDKLSKPRIVTFMDEE
ncbi:flagellar motor protein MotA [Aphanothece hegewaldii CCALA 016]|uniref:Flagellar motor protein MotA n=1 Tax=Aphanothece hegewaldii CCALA 016 TaxID=2107694 RepID=A0A2T1M3A6_9CHRO|nr:MotA/TolQ/ExbB proton channel family protein [Aphanothece hegewaldii]PSF39312.1 flagellar motor protein MotA [Aphanothece hegewaldii CCALA 016]